MQTRFEHFAVGSMMGEADSPPRTNGTLCFAREWERTAFGLAIALAREGHYEWEEFREELIAEIDGWEKSHALDDPNWDYYERWLNVLEHLVATRLPTLAPDPPGGLSTFPPNIQKARIS